MRYPEKMKFFTIYEQARLIWGQRARVALSAFHQGLLEAVGAVKVGTVSDKAGPLRFVYVMPQELA